MSNNHAGAVGFLLQDGAEERIEFGVDQNNMLAPVERFSYYASRWFHAAGYFHQDIDGVAGGQHRWIVSQDWNSAGDGCFCVASRCDPVPCHNAGFAECPFAMLGGPVGNRHKTNPRRRRSQLQRDGASRRARAYHADTDGTAGGFTLSKGCVYDHLGLLSCRSMSGQLRSCSDIAVAARGH